MAIEQNPASIIKVGFQSKTLTGFCPTGVTLTHGADIEHITCNGEFKTSVIRNKSHTISFDAVILDAGTLAGIVAGDDFTIDSIIYLCTSVSYVLSDSAARISLQGIKHADAAYT
jgi:hypothetical protein